MIAGEPIDAQVIRDNIDADVRIFLRDENNNLIECDNDGSESPAVVSVVAQTSGQWTLAVLADSGVTVRPLHCQLQSDIIKRFPYW